MANEIRGILAEVVIEFALIKVVKLSGVKGIVRWNVKSKGMSIKPDFTIGNNIDKPMYILMFKSSISSKNYQHLFHLNQNLLIHF